MLPKIFENNWHINPAITMARFMSSINLLKTSPEYTRAGVNGKCVL